MQSVFGCFSYPEDIDQRIESYIRTLQRRQVPILTPEEYILGYHGFLFTFDHFPWFRFPSMNQILDRFNVVSICNFVFPVCRDDERGIVNMSQYYTCEPGVFLPFENRCFDKSIAQKSVDKVSNIIRRSVKFCSMDYSPNDLSDINWIEANMNASFISVIERPFIECSSLHLVSRYNIHSFFENTGND